MDTLRVLIDDIVDARPEAPFLIAMLDGDKAVYLDLIETDFRCGTTWG
jgi:hypothetical protein